MAKFDFGSEVLCVDFHLHTRRDKEFEYTGESDTFIGNYIDALKQKGISVGVITNHNKFDLEEYKALRKKARQKDIFLLPGVELSIKEGSNGLHTLIIFNPDEWISNGEDTISNFITTAFQGIPNHENANTRCLYDVRLALEALERYGKDYFIVFAHVEQDNGLIKECGGGMIQSLAQLELFKKRILGVQKLRTRDNIPKLAQWLGYDIACVEGSDPKRIEEIGKDGCQTYIKLGEFSFDALKYALVDHRSRIFDNYEHLRHSHIESINFIGGKLNGISVNMSPQLNTLIGIRGSGKSSILEVLRWVLDLQASADQKYKDKLVEFILGSGGKAVVRVADQYGRKYDVSRINGDRAYIVDSDNKDITAQVSSLIRNPLYFGQKDLARSDTEENYEKKLLDKLLGGRISIPVAELEQAETQLIEVIKSLLDVTQIPEKIKELETQNADLDHKLKIFEEKGITQKLEKQAEFGNDKIKLEGTIKTIEAVATKLDEFIQISSLDGIALSSYTSKCNAALFARAQVVIDRITAILQKISDLRTELGNEKNILTGLQSELAQLIDGLKDEFAEIQREISDDSLDIKGFLKYTQDKAKNVEDIERLKREATSVDEIKKRILGLARQRNDLLKSVFDGYQTEIGRLNGKQDALVITIDFKGNTEALSRLVAQSFRGTMIRSAEIKTTQICGVLRDGVAILLDILMDGGKELKKILVEAEYIKFSEKVQNEYSQYVRCQSEDHIDILYHGKPLSEHSLGQRASALILSILTQDDSDIIIIDQPEDDLDNQVVYKEFIKTVKSKKANVQFIFATHNPNIPVLGDAERVIATAFTENAITASMGSIDNAQSHTLIVDIMEGGQEAFCRRNNIYQAWHKY
ncbi:DNA repair ATPase [Desulfitobacterium hafniense]|uniref:DNA repair ATPase n=1 Tax=Desulfitobacterium hafniense TaxID=49338 RepID=A0A098AUI3_DESHA|nr:AAA family ATPase [Desulfitobacterium hafniense]CDX00048.1 DNA repair ATPase [Desulfitobacterium hafniense]